MKPKIGVVVCGFIENKQFVTNAYIQSVRYSGGIPLILPLIRSDQVLKEYAALCDGFLFCGGNDITPLLQIRLMKEVLKTNKPVFSICRGMQVFNVACGGTIFQDISLQPGTHLDHMQQSDTRSEVSHKIHVRPGTQLKKYVGSLVYVNSYHHQTLDRIGKNLTVSAVATDQTVEAIELPSHPFAIGVQWHPECMYRTSSDMRELFGSFILCATHGGAVSAE